MKTLPFWFLVCSMMQSNFIRRFRRNLHMHKIFSFSVGKDIKNGFNLKIVPVETFILYFANNLTCSFLIVQVMTFLVAVNNFTPLLFVSSFIPSLLTRYLNFFKYSDFLILVQSHPFPLSTVIIEFSSHFTHHRFFAWCQVNIYLDKFFCHWKIIMIIGTIKEKFYIMYSQMLRTLKFLGQKKLMKKCKKLQNIRKHL